MDGCLLRSARFEKASLEGAYFTNAYLVGADLRYARLAGANFSGAWLYGASFEGVRFDHVRIESSHHNTEPIVSWIQEELGPGPWRWPVLREQLDAPSEDALGAIRAKLTRLNGQQVHNRQIREMFRQLYIFVEKELNLHSTECVSEVELVRVLTVRGINSS